MNFLGISELSDILIKIEDLQFLLMRNDNSKEYIYEYKCKRSGHLHYHYRTIYKKCDENDHNDFDIVLLAKIWKLLPFDHLHTLPPDYETVKLTLGIVELDYSMRITDS